MSSWERDGQSWLRPQSVVFTLLAEQVVPRDVAVSSGSFIRALAGLGITEHATRATLSRMVQRELLERHRRGRRVFFAMTPRCRHVLADGARRIWQVGAVNRDPGTAWTILTFSLPESSQRERHVLRSRLAWAGLGSLHGGVWIGPSPPADVEPVVDELGLDDHVHLFRVEANGATDLPQVAREAFDLDDLARGYQQFLADWEDEPTDRPSTAPLALTLRLSTEWLQVIGDDPRIPVTLLPESWPAVEAQQRFHALHGANATAAAAVAAGALDPIDLDGA
jgi:phenylacetic acid degradation operon negative regulatory protein